MTVPLISPFILDALNLQTTVQCMNNCVFRKATPGIIATQECTPILGPLTRDISSLSLAILGDLA